MSPLTKTARLTLWKDANWRRSPQKLNYPFKSCSFSWRLWRAAGCCSSVEACDYRSCVFGNRDGLFFSLSAALADWTGVMLSSCFSSSTCVWLPSLNFPSPSLPLSLQRSHLLPISLSLFSVSLSLRHWALLHSLTIWASPPLKCVFLCVCLDSDRHVWARIWEQLLLKRAYMCMSLFVCVSLNCVCVGVCVCVCQ